MIPTILDFGRFKLHSFGLMVALSFLVTTLMAGRRFRKAGLDPERASEIGLGAMIGGVVGAKLYYALDHLSDTLADPFGVLFSGSGLTWYGGLLGGVLGSLWVARSRRIPLLKLCDVGAPLVALGYAIGRVGCWLNGDDYGRPSSVPWAMAFPKGTPPTQVRVHPTQLYEVAAGLIIFLALDALARRTRPTGLIFGAYLVMAGAARFLVEFYRLNEPGALGLTLAQWISVGMAAVGIWLLERTRGPAGSRAS